MHLPISNFSITSKLLFFNIDKLPIISEILIYRLLIIFHRYFARPYIRAMTIQILNVIWNSYLKKHMKSLKHRIIKEKSTSPTTTPTQDPEPKVLGALSPSPYVLGDLRCLWLKVRGLTAPESYFRDLELGLSKGGKSSANLTISLLKNPNQSLSDLTKENGPTGRYYLIVKFSIFVSILNILGPL